MRVLIASPLGFLIGVALGALGGGGSILAVPVLVYAAGESPKAATTTSLVVVGVTALGGALAHHRAGHLRVAAGVGFGLAGIGGSLAGSALNHAVADDVLLLAFAGLMAVAGWRMWVNQPCAAVGDLARPQRRCRPVDEGPAGGGGTGTLTATRTATGTDTGTGTGSRKAAAGGAARVVRILVAGTAVGFVTGFFGVGGGFVVVPALVLALGFRMPEAVGTSLLVIAVNAGVALLSRLGTTGIDVGVALPFTLAGLLGVSVGARLAAKVPTAVLVRRFVMLLGVVAVYVAGQAALGLIG